MAGNSSTRIGGETPELRHVLYFAFGVALGSGIRLGMWLLPTGLVDSVLDRIL